MKITKIGAWIRSVFALPQMRDLRALPETQLLLRRRWLLSKGPGSNVSGVQRDVALKLIAGRGQIPKAFRTNSGLSGV
jgi:hypothetical protein